MSALRVLIAEDNADDAELLERELRRGGFALETRRVQAAEPMREALASRIFDLVISDFTMPGFDALRALDVLKASSQGDLPFIIVSGMIGEERLVDALWAGADDFVIKGSLSRLLPSVRRSLEEARMRRERNTAVLALEAAVRARDEFLSIAAHELKTPLTALILQTQTLTRIVTQEDGPPGSAGQLLTRLKGVDRSVLRLRELIDRLLDFSRIAEGPLALHRERTDLAALIRAVVVRIRDAAPDSSTHLQVVAPEHFEGEWDRERLDAVLSNLVSNAMKYGEKKPVTVTLAREGSDAVVEVRDHGIGIAPGDQSRIFGRFERAVSERHYGGFGIGLWLVRQVVEAHGGTVEVTSTPGAGATFRVRLPTHAPIDG